MQLGDLKYREKKGKHKFNKYSLRITFLRDIQEENLSLQYGDEKQRQLVSELWDIDKGKIPVESLSLPSNARRFLIARETIPVNFKRKIF